MKNIKLPSSVYNWLTAFGTLMAIGAILVFLFLLIISTFTGTSSSYLGLFMFIIVPPFLVIGLLLIPIGMYYKNREIKRSGNQGMKAPVFDFNKNTHRNAAMIFISGTIIFLLMTALGSYEAFHFSESNVFCGEVCHSVMHPEFIAYQNSAHARVKCVECHVGEGVDWYVKSKLSGLRQIYGVATGDYDKPIPTPISNLRPARETCEKCHWPEKFYSRTNRLEKHFLADEENTPWDIYLTLKVGGEHTSEGLSEGIHWHVDADNIVQYLATDEQRQDIPYVRFINKKTGDTTVYIDSDSDFVIEDIANYELREMECIDCHNRPSHQYLPPDRFINNELARGTISTEIPEIKAKLLEICENEFTSIDSLKKYSTKEILTFYEEEYPEIFEENKAGIVASIDAFIKVYSENIFPEMKVTWDKYPSNIGHMNFKGCFRCHNGLHESEEGKVLERDCNQCHIINAQGSPDNLARSEFNIPLEFKHPVDIEEAWKEMNCSECHSGLLP